MKHATMIDFDETLRIFFVMQLSIYLFLSVIYFASLVSPGLDTVRSENKSYAGNVNQLLCVLFPFSNRK